MERKILWCLVVIGLAALTVSVIPDMIAEANASPTLLPRFPAELSLAESATALETAISKREDYGCRGNVAILSTGRVILERTRVAQIKMDHGFVSLPLAVESVLLGLPGDWSKAGGATPVAVVSREESNFALSWIPNSNDGILLVDGVAWPVIAIPTGGDPPSQQPGPTCSVTCGEGESATSCTMTCPPGKACIAYCDGATPICKCVKIPAESEAVVD